jgi:DNA-binding Lrp family transcriptional regulator
LKRTELRLIAELVRDSRRSDRELATLLNVSPPTVARIRQRLEKDGIIEYNAIPNLGKLGYEIIAVTLGKRDFVRYPQSVVQKARDFVEQHPNVIFAADGNGLDYDVISISIHRDYSDYSKFMSDVRAQAGETMKADSFLIDTLSEGIVQPLSLRRFAEVLIQDGQEERKQT